MRAGFWRPGDPFWKPCGPDRSFSELSTCFVRYRRRNRPCPGKDIEHGVRYLIVCPDGGTGGQGHGPRADAAAAWPGRRADRMPYRSARQARDRGGHVAVRFRQADGLCVSRGPARADEAERRIPLLVVRQRPVRGLPGLCHPNAEQPFQAGDEGAACRGQGADRNAGRTPARRLCAGSGRRAKACWPE